eukprot:SAG31_NODE_218_length_19934_cov_81.634837_17_plen_150_part_00
MNQLVAVASSTAVDVHSCTVDQIKMHALRSTSTVSKFRYILSNIVSSLPRAPRPRGRRGHQQLAPARAVQALVCGSSAVSSHLLESKLSCVGRAPAAKLRHPAVSGAVSCMQWLRAAERFSPGVVDLIVHIHTATAWPWRSFVLIYWAD